MSIRFVSYVFTFWKNSDNLIFQYLVISLYILMNTTETCATLLLLGLSKKFKCFVQ